MAKGINKVILIGNFGGEPELRAFPDGGRIASVSLATSNSWKDKQTGQQMEHTEWHRLVFRNRLAEIVGEYTHKGSKVYVEGSLRTRKWQDKQGIERYTTEVVCHKMEMLDSRNSNPNYTQPPQQQSYQSPTNNQQTYQQNSQSSMHQNSNNFDDFDDDIPF